MDVPILPIPKALTPFPLLGWPDWHPNNDKEQFYDRAKPPNPGSFAVIASIHTS